MKQSINKRYFTIGLYSFVVIALSLTFFQVISNLTTVNEWLYNLLSPVFPILYGFIIAYLLDPIMVSIEDFFKKHNLLQKLKKKTIRGISLLLTYIFAISLIVIFLLIVMPRVIESLSNMVLQIQDYIAWAQNSVTSLLEGIPDEMLPDIYIDEINETIGKAITDFISLLSNSVPLIFSVAVNISSKVIGAVVGVIVSCYLLFSKETFLAQFKKVAFSILKTSRIEEMSRLLSTTDLMFGKFITGKIIDSIIIGFLCFIGLTLLKMPNTVLVSFIVGITNVIPYFGPFLGAIPSFFLIAFISPAKGIIFLLFVLLLQQLDGNIIGPMILGDSTGLSAFWVVFAILFFGGAFGIVGMIIAVPTMGVIFWIIKNKIAVLLREREMPSDTEFYKKPVGEIASYAKKQAVQEEKEEENMDE